MWVEFTGFSDPRYTREGTLIFEGRFREIGEDPERKARRPKGGRPKGDSGRQSVLLVGAASGKRQSRQVRKIRIPRSTLDRRAREAVCRAELTLAEAREFAFREILKNQYGLTMGTLGRLDGIHQSSEGLTAEKICDVQSPDDLIRETARAAARKAGQQPQKGTRPALAQAMDELRQVCPQPEAPAQPGLFTLLPGPGTEENQESQEEF